MTVTTVTQETMLLYWIWSPKFSYCYSVIANLAVIGFEVGMEIVGLDLESDGLGTYLGFES